VLEQHGGFPRAPCSFYADEVVAPIDFGAKVAMKTGFDLPCAMIHGVKESSHFRIVHVFNPQKRLSKVFLLSKMDFQKSLF
jgi:hypothetical protein